MREIHSEANYILINQSYNIIDDKYILMDYEVH